MLPLFQSNMGKNHLDIGSGTGYYLRNAGIPASMQLTLVGKERPALNVGLKRSGHPNAKGIVADILEQLPFKDKFDSISYITCCSAFRLQWRRSAAYSRT